MTTLCKSIARLQKSQPCVLVWRPCIVTRPSGLRASGVSFVFYLLRPWLSLDGVRSRFKVGNIRARMLALVQTADPAVGTFLGWRLRVNKVRAGGLRPYVAEDVHTIRHVTRTSLARPYPSTCGARRVRCDYFQGRAKGLVVLRLETADPSPTSLVPGVMIPERVISPLRRLTQAPSEPTSLSTPLRVEVETCPGYQGWTAGPARGVLNYIVDGLNHNIAAAAGGWTPLSQSGVSRDHRGVTPLNEYRKPVGLYILQKAARFRTPRHEGDEFLSFAETDSRGTVGDSGPGRHSDGPTAPKGKTNE